MEIKRENEKNLKINKQRKRINKLNNAILENNQKKNEIK